MPKVLTALALIVALLIPSGMARASLDTNLQIRLQSTLTSTTGLATATVPLSQLVTIALATGTGANQADKIYQAERTIAASSSETLDLAGTLTDSLGATITCARVKLMLFYALSTNTNNVLIGGNGANDFINWVASATDIVVVRPGGLFLLAAPDVTAYAVTAGTGDLIKVANSSSGTGVTYRVVIICASA